MKPAPDIRLSVLHAWSVYLASRDMQSMQTAMLLTSSAVNGSTVSVTYTDELAREIEADFREMLAALRAQRPKRKKSNEAIKRKTLKHCVRLDAKAPILQQVRSLVR